MTTTTVTNASPSTLLASGASRWVTIQNQGGGSIRVKHDATGDPVSQTNGTLILPGETLLLSDAPAAAAITAQACGATCPVCVQTGSL